jgi:hypothetical protein
MTMIASSSFVVFLTKELMSQKLFKLQKPKFALCLLSKGRITEAYNQENAVLVLPILSCSVVRRGTARRGGAQCDTVEALLTDLGSTARRINRPSSKNKSFPFKQVFPR